MIKNIFYKPCKNKKGVGLMAITMMFSIAISLLASAALLTAVNSSHVSAFISQGAQAEQLANTGIDRVSWMLLQKCLRENSVKGINYSANTPLSGDDSASNSLTMGTTATFSYPRDVPIGQYKVKIISCKAITMRGSQDPNNGIEVVIESVAKVGNDKGGSVTRRVTKTMEFYETNNNLFSKAIMGNNVPACMFCHINVYGGVACMGDGAGLLSHGTSGGSKIYGDLVTGGDFLRKGLFGSYSSDSALFGTAPSGQSAYKVKDNYHTSSENTTNPLPTSMDVFQNNKRYILRQCTDSTFGDPGTIKVDYASQITPGKLYSTYANEDARIDALKAATTTSPVYGVYHNTTTNKYYISSKYDNDSLSSLDTTTTYDSPITLVGSKTHPIEIQGKVYIDGDVIIKGTVTGQGVIYSSRNIYILGNLEYKNGPAWSTNMAHAPYDETKDKLGFVAAGNVLIGDPFTPASTASPRSYYNANAYGPKKYNGGQADYGTANYNGSGYTSTRFFRWQGYIRSLMVDGIFAGNEAGNSDLHYASQFDTWDGIPAKGENFIFHNRYAWDGRDKGEVRRVRLACNEDTHSGIKKSFPDKTSDRYGLLPRGSRAAELTDTDIANDIPSKAVSTAYTDLDPANGRRVWIPYNEWNAFVNKDCIKNDNKQVIGASDPNQQIPRPSSTTVHGYPEQVDGILYAEGCLVGANFENAIKPNFHGSFVSNDTHYINAAGENTGYNTNIFLDNRASSSFMGFPNDIRIYTTGYNVSNSSTTEFSSY